jgi:hypothetical protein
VESAVFVLSDHGKGLVVLYTVSPSANHLQSPLKLGMSDTGAPVSLVASVAAESDGRRATDSGVGSCARVSLPLPKERPQDCKLQLGPLHPFTQIQIILAKGGEPIGTPSRRNFTRPRKNLNVTPSPVQYV